MSDRQPDNDDHNDDRKDRHQRSPSPQVPVTNTDPLLKLADGSQSDSLRDVSRDTPRGAAPVAPGLGTWSPGYWSQFPLRGGLALFFCLVFIAASIAVLVRSDGQPVSDWVLSPTVYLALFTTATNLLARYAFTEGARIAWWTRALQGSTVENLGDRWAHANNFWSALFAGRSFDVVALGSIAATIIVIDQPLIQRASSVVSVQKMSPVLVEAPIAPEIPWGYTGYQDGRATTSQVMTQPMISAFNQFNSQSPIVTGFAGCKDTCNGYVEAGGLSARCNTTTGPVFYNIGGEAGSSAAPFSASFSLQQRSENTSSRLILNVAYTDNSGACTGTRTERTCSLAPATLRYPVKLVGDVVTLGDALLNGSTTSFQPPGSINNTFMDGGGDYSSWTLGGLYVAASTLFNSNATYTFGGGIGTYPTLPDTLSNQFLDLSPDSFNGVKTSSNVTVAIGCNLNWTDPTPHILSELNSMAFMLSLSAATHPYRNTSAPPVAQRLTMMQTSDVNVYRSEYRFLVASTILTTAFVLLIAPTFFGWWELGRRVTLNPIETAKAFDAELLRGVSSNAELSALVSSIGGRRLRLGEVETSSAGGTATGVQLKFADPGEVVRPRPGVAYM